MNSMKMFGGGGLIWMMLILINTVEGLALRQQLVMAMEQQAMSQASMELLMIANSELADSCPTDKCELCDKIDVSFDYSQNNYPCDNSGSDCCGSQCSDLGVTLSYLEAYVKYLQPLIKTLLDEEKSFMAKVEETKKSLEDEQSSTSSSVACIQAQIKLRSKALTKLRAKIAYLQFEKAGALYNLQRVFKECVDETWCENDATQDKILPDESLWAWLDENKCEIISYLVDVAASLADIGLKYYFPFLLKLSKNQICDVDIDVQGFLQGKWKEWEMKEALMMLFDVQEAEEVAEKKDFDVKEELLNWVLGTLLQAMCKLKDDVPDDITPLFESMCWISDLVGSTTDKVDNMIISVWVELFQTFQNLCCGNWASVILSLAKMPIMCKSDSMCAVDLVDDCKSSAILYFTGWKPAETLAPTQAPTVAVRYGHNVIAVDSDNNKSLPVGFTIDSMSNKYQFEIMSGGNAVLHHKPGPDVWDTMTKSTNNPEWVFQKDGNLVQYIIHNDKRVSKWSSGTAGNGKFLAVSDYGYAMILNPQLEVKWSSFGLASPVNSLHKTEMLEPGFSMKSNNQKYEMIFQDDGNLVVYDLNAGRKPIFSTDSDSYYGYRPYFVFVAEFGEFYIKCRDCTFTTTAFSSHTYCKADDGPFVMLLTDAGELQIVQQQNANEICFNSRYDF